MPRPLRITNPNIPFHVLNRGNNRQAIFLEEEDYLRFLKLIRRYKEKPGFRLYHFCLMPNHYHLLLESTKEGGLTEAMAGLAISYSKYFSRKYQTVGHFWQGRFKSSLVDREEYFLWCGLYIELNPLRAGLVKAPQEWRWSSYSFYAQGKAEPLIEGLIDLDPYFLELSGDDQERRRLYRKRMEETGKDFLEDIRTKMRSGVYGRPEFVKEMRAVFSLGSPRGIGRPRKE